MKRMGKFLTLILLILLLFVFSAPAFATKNEDNLVSSVSSIAGASRVAEDVEGESFNLQNRLTPAIVGTKFSYGTAPAALNTEALKFGNLRSMRTTDNSNTYAEWRFHQADDTTINGNEDAYIALGNRSYDVTDLSYQVLEFDMTTMTSFPSNLSIFSEWRGSDNSGRERVRFGSYYDDDGLWHFGDKTLLIEQNEWVHITLVFAIRRSGSNAYDFTETVARIFVNGELYNEITPYESASLASGVRLRQHYLAVGWLYGKAGARPGMDENASVCIDNVTLTTLNRASYGGNLEEVFSGSFTNLNNYSGKEIVYKSTYPLPSSAMAMATVTKENGDVLPFSTLEDAVEYVSTHSLTGAKITLLADQYNPIEITSALTLDSAGHTLRGGYTLGNNITLSSTDGDCLQFTDPTVAPTPQKPLLTVIYADGKRESLTSTEILAKIPRGATVILEQDLPCPTSFYGTDYAVDLNGYTVYAVDGAKQEIFRGMEAVYVYSSRPGARVFTGTYMKNGSTDANGNPLYTNQAAFIVSDAGAVDGTKFMLGYKRDNTATPYPIDMFCGAFSQLSKFNNVSIYLKGLNIIAAAGDNKGIFTTRNEKNNRYWQIDDCTILITNNKSLCANVNVKKSVGTYVFNNTSILGNGSLFGTEGVQSADCYVTFNHTNVYGSHSINCGDFTSTESGVVYEYTRYLILSEGCAVTDLSQSGAVLPEGYMFIPEVSVSSSGTYLFPAAGRYINFESGDYTLVGGSYSARGYIGKMEEFTRCLFQSVAIDSSVSVLIYMPQSSSIDGVYLGELNLLDRSNTKLINNRDYYVVRVNIPPKDAYKDCAVTIRFASTDFTVSLDASLLSYARKLADVCDTKATGTYYLDSNLLMKYVLAYVREAALSIGGASVSSLSEIDALLGTFTVPESDKTIRETVYTTSSISGALTAATLNLDAKVGMVFRVAKGFVGTISVEMPHSSTIVKSYTAKSPAPDAENLLLENIPAYALCEDITITVTTASTTKSITYNLATYVNGTKTSIAYSIYSYAKVAERYHEKYPNAFVYGD